MLRLERIMTKKITNNTLKMATLQTPCQQFEYSNKSVLALGVIQRTIFFDGKIPDKTESVLNRLKMVFSRIWVFWRELEISNKTRQNKMQKL